MNLTQRERTILQLSQQGLSDYKIARRINTDPPSVTRSRKTAHKKLIEAAIDLNWAARIGMKFSDINASSINTLGFYNYFL